MHLQSHGVTCEIAGRTILSDVDLTVARGRMVALVGINGSGKSTLIRVLTGLRSPAGGRVTVDGTDLASLPARRRATLLAHVGQEESPPDDLLLGEMVAMGRIPHRPPWAVGKRSEQGIVHDALDKVGLAHAAERRCNQLSGGERRRAMLARGIAQGSELLVLDEPTNHLDVHHQIQLLETVRGLGQTVVAAMHDLPLATTYFDDIAVLHDGGLLTLDTAENALASATVEKVFSVDAARLEHPTTGREHLVLGPGSTPTPHPALEESS